jgi:hypothetical protein
MSIALSLPVETWCGILTLLSKADQKSFRLASKFTAQLVAPHLFKTVLFDLEPQGCDGLAAIAQSSHLRGHVRVLQLQRRAGLPECLMGTYDEWYRANIFEYKPQWQGHGDYERCPIQGLMSEEEWRALSDEQARQLYDLFKAEHVAHDTSMADLASAAFGGLLSNSDPRSAQPTPSPRTCPALALFNTAVTALTTVQKFVHKPAFHIDPYWACTWRRLEFHPKALAEFMFRDDPHADALQVFIAVCWILATPNALSSVEFYTLGPAFWTMDQLQRILSWNDSDFGMSNPNMGGVDSPGPQWKLGRWIQDFEGYQGALRGMAALTRIVGDMERRFSRLTQLTCYIDTLWDAPGESPISSDQTLSRVFHAAQHLTYLSIRYRNEAHMSGHHRCFTFFNNKHQPIRYPPLDMFLPDIEEMKCPIVDAIPAIRPLRQLHLSCPTTHSRLTRTLSRLPSLQSLSLMHVALIHGRDSWEGTFGWIARTLRLEKVQLQYLEDFHDMQQRLILCPTWPVWDVDDSSRQSYSEYERAICQFVLRQRDSLVPLAPEAYLQMHPPSEAM